MAKSKQTTTIIPLNIIDLHEDGFHLLIEITLSGKNFTLVLDTGASKTAFDKALLEAEGEVTLRQADELSTGLGTNSMVSYKLHVDDLHIDDLLIEPFEAAVLDLSTINVAYSQLGHPTVLGVLGGDVLMKYKAVIDYELETLSLKK